MLALVLCGWVGGQYFWSVLVLTANAIGLVFDFLWPIEMDKPKCSKLAFVKQIR